MSLKAIVAKAEFALGLQYRLVDLQSQSANVAKQLDTLLKETLPDMMMEEGASRVELSKGGTVAIRQVISASIPSQGAIDKARGEDRDALLARKRDALAWLRENKGASLIKSEVSVAFATGEEKKAIALFKRLRKEKLNPLSEEKIHPQSLNKFIREKLEAGVDIPAEPFSLYTGQIAEIELPGQKAK